MHCRCLELDHVWHFSGNQFHVDLDLPEIDLRFDVGVFHLVFDYALTPVIIERGI